MGRPSLAEPRRRQIIDGLRSAIVKHGLADASVQRIAGYAGVPAGLIHHYFDSKEDLLIATVDLVVEDAREPIKAELDVLDPERALERALDLAEPDGVLLWFLLHPAPGLLERHARQRTRA